jgi:hypothetical protein
MISLRSFNPCTSLKLEKKILIPAFGRLFWHFVDRQDVPKSTPLFTGIHEYESLSLVIAPEFDPQLHGAESAIEIARREVAL